MRHSGLLLGESAPCQPFSARRKRIGSRDAVVLLGDFDRSLVAIRPIWVLNETVPAIPRVPSVSTIRRFFRMLVGDRRNRIARFVEAQRFGVFWNRGRLVPRTARNRIPALPALDHGPARQPFRTVRESIARFPPIPAGGNGGLSDVYGHMHWYRPAPALTGRCYSISNGRCGHSEQGRAISLRAAAALRSSPDPHCFVGSATGIAQPVCNAVPVSLAECLGKHLLRLQRAACLKAA